MRRAACLALLVACGDSADSSLGANGEAPPPEMTPPIVEVRILAFNDLHGWLEPPTGTTGSVDGKEAGGAAYLAAHVKALRTANTVVVSSGDLTGASPLLSGLFHDEPTVLAMNAMGLDLNGVGNHEFDHGVTELLRLQKGGCHPTDGCIAGQPPFPGAKYEYLAANVDDAAKQTIFPPYAIVNVGGEPIAFVGMTLQATGEIVPQQGITGLRFEKEAATINALVPEIKTKGAVAIVALLHQGDVPRVGTKANGCGIEGGYLDALVSAMDPAVTIVHSAHTHQPYVCTLGGRTVTSASSFGRVLTQIDLTIDHGTEQVTKATATNVIVTHDVKPDPDVASVVATFESLSAPLANRVVGHLTADLGTGIDAAGESAMGDVLADAQLDATKVQGAQIAFTNTGGIRNDLKSAAVTYAQAFAVQPFQNDLVTMDFAGADLKALLDQQFALGGNVLQVSDSLRYAWSETSGVDATSITVSGTPFDAASTYRVTVSSYLAGGGDGFTLFTKGKNVVTSGTDIDAFVTYLTAHDPLTPPMPSRITKQ